MINIDSFGGRIGNIQWQNTWNELWGHTGFWEKIQEKKVVSLFGVFVLGTKILEKSND
jgi:hypothetical protein